MNSVVVLGRNAKDAVGGNNRLHHSLGGGGKVLGLLEEGRLLELAARVGEGAVLAEDDEGVVGGDLRVC